MGGLIHMRGPAREGICNHFPRMDGSVFYVKVALRHLIRGRHVMLNNPAFESIEVDFDALLLDLKNPRIYAWEPSSQAEAIIAIMEARGNQTYNLAKDIAQNGLGIPPIIVMPSKEEGKFVVMDGNRRIAAMKILANPALAPEKYRKRLFGIVKKSCFELPDKISVVVSNDIQAVTKEIMRLHTGEQKGVGQVSWAALEQEMFSYDHGLRLRYDLATKFLIVANNLGVTQIRTEEFMQKFPITTLDRLLSKERLEKIGVDISDPSAPIFFANEDVVKFRMQKIINDMLEGKVHVSEEGAKEESKSIRTPDAQEEYLADVLQENHSGKTFVPMTKNKTSTETAVQKPSTTQRARSAPSDPYDRTRLIPNGKTKQYGIRINKQAPDKLKAIYRELAKLRLNETPMAAAILLRTFMELTVEYCIKEHDISPKGSTLANRMQACAEHLFRKNSKEYTRVAPLWGKDHFLTVKGLNQVVHAPDFPVDNKRVCIFWEQAMPFLLACLK